MDLYLPIANLSVNALVIVALGGVVGLLSGMFGVGGGFLTTPLLIFYGIPPTVAAASASSQVTGASVSGALAHFRRGGVDIHMGLVMVAGGIHPAKVSTSRRARGRRSMANPLDVEAPAACLGQRRSINRLRICSEQCCA